MLYITIDLSEMFNFFKIVNIFGERDYTFEINNNKCKIKLNFKGDDLIMFQETLMEYINSITIRENIANN